MKYSAVLSKEVKLPSEHRVWCRKPYFHVQNPYKQQYLCFSRNTVCAGTMGEILFASHVHKVRLGDQKTPLWP